MESKDDIRELDEGELLFSKGEPSDYAFRVIAGRFEVFGEVDGERTVIMVVEAGGFLGELGLLSGTPRSASVKAVCAGRVECFDRERFVAMAADDSGSSIELIRNLSSRTRGLFDLADELIEERRSKSWRVRFSDFFTGFFGFFRRRLVAKRGLQEAVESSSIHGEGTMRVLPAAETLFHEGAPSAWAARVDSGRLEARKKVGLKWVTLGEIGPGQLVGELGLLEGRPRSATIVAVEESRIEILTKELLLSRLASDPLLAKQMILDLSDRAIRLSKFLIEVADDADLSDPTLARRVRGMLGSIDDVIRLASDVVEHDLRRLQHGLAQEAKAVGRMFATYQAYLAGAATEQDMEAANHAFRNLLKTLGLGTLFLLPGGMITIPLVVKLGQRFGVDLLPKLELGSGEYGAASESSATLTSE